MFALDHDPEIFIKLGVYVFKVSMSWMLTGNHQAQLKCFNAEKEEKQDVCFVMPPR